jgi:hypothetical protein
MNKLFYIVLMMSGGLLATELPVWFDVFQDPLKSQAGWQTFRAATAMELADDADASAGKVLKATVTFSPTVCQGILIWRFPDVQMKKFRMRVKAPKEAREVYLSMISNDTKGDAAFFKPWNNGKSLFNLPINTVEGPKLQPASPLPAGEWVTYEAAMPDDVFYEQKKQKSNNAVLDFALMNTGRDQLKLSAESRPATEAFFISFTVSENSPLIGRKLEFMIDFAEVY